MIVGVVGSGKARGVTTVAAGLAQACAGLVGSSLLIEADAAGGDIGYWRDLAVEDHSVLTAAAAIGASPTFEAKAAALAAHGWSHPKSPGAVVLPLAAAGPLENQLASLWASAVGLFRSLDGVVVVDLGRWSDGVVSRIWADVEVRVVVVDGSLPGLKRAHLGSRLEPMSSATVRVVNGSPWSLDEIARSTGLGFDYLLPWDRKGAKAIAAGDWKSGSKTTLGRNVREVAEMVRSMSAEAVGLRQ